MMIASQTSNKRALWLPAVGFAFLFAMPLGAQTFSGRVVDDSTKRPLEAASITLLDAAGNLVSKSPVRTDTAGRFVIHAVRPGRYAIRANRIGYAQLTSRPIELFGGSITTTELAMSAIQQKLGTIVVTAPRRLNLFELYSELGFNLRRSKGQGKFLDTLDLKTYGTLDIGSVFLAHAGLFMWASRYKPSVYVMHNGIASDGYMNECYPEMMVDGFIGRGANFMGFADEIFAIEVYSPWQIPPPSLAGELGMTQSAKPRKNRCGAIFVWTKGYINEMNAKQAKQGPPGRNH